MFDIDIRHVFGYDFVAVKTVTPPIASVVGCETAFGRSRVFSMYRTSIYIDGFNLYYRALKDTPYKWLDLEALSHLLLPKNDILCIKYFTALVAARQRDPDQPIRQQTYLRAIQSSPLVDIIYGFFRPPTPVRMPLAYPLAGGPNTVEVLKTEEKGSDVNLATHLLWDAVQNRYDVAAVISNDSDLVCAIRIAREELGKRIVVLNPSRNNQSVELQQVSHYLKVIRQTHVAQCQFSNPLITPSGQQIHKPATW
jgi:uncharacterized LabA/DUF88 family protein